MQTKKQIIFLRGKAGSGKDFYADLLGLNFTSSTKLSLAGPLKRIIAATFDITLDELDRLKKSEPSGNKRAMRTILQRFGTEGMKPEFGVDVWSELLYKTIQKSSDTLFIISDLRFDTEIAYFKEKEEFDITVVEIVREDLDENSTMYNHASEQGFKDSTPDVRIENVIGESDENLQKIISAHHNIVL